MSASSSSASHFFRQLRIYWPAGRRSAIVTLQLLTAVHLFHTDLFEVRLCSGFSMLPTFSHQGDFVLISPIPVKFHESSSTMAAKGKRVFDDDDDDGPRGGSGGRNDHQRIYWRGIRRGDIVVATSPTDPGKTVCKRVLGLEGDIIEVDPTRRATAGSSTAEGRSNHLHDEFWSQAQSTKSRRRSGDVQDEDGDSSATVLSPAEAWDLKNSRRWEELDADHRYHLEGKQRESPNVPIPAAMEELPPSPITSQTMRRPTPVRSRGDPTESLAMASPVFSPSLSSRSHIGIPRGYIWLAGDNMSNSTDSRSYGPVPLGLVKGKVLARVWPNPRWITRDDAYTVLKGYDD